MTRTTTSCSAVALALLIGTSVLAQSRASSELSLFPVQTAWNTPVDAVLGAPPRLAGHRAFLPIDDAHLTAYDLETGESVWSVECRPTSAPAAGGELLFVAEADAISARRQDTGEQVWRLPFTERLATPLVWDNGWLIAATEDGNLVALRASDGTRIWEHAVQAHINAPPALAADRVYAPLSDGRIVALDVATGAEKWTRRLGGAVNDMLALDDRLYAGSDDNYFYSINTTNGSVNWRWRTGGDVIGVPVIDERRVYFVSKDNLLRALDRNSGSQRWKRELPGRPTRSPVRAGDVLLVSGLAPKVTAYAVKDGTPAGEVTSPGELAASPFIVQQRGLPQVVIVSRDVTAGTRIVAFRRNIEPALATSVGPLLPNPIPQPRPLPAPTSPTTP